EVALEVLGPELLDLLDDIAPLEGPFLDMHALAAGRDLLVELADAREARARPALAADRAAALARAEDELAEEVVLLEALDVARELALRHLDPLGHPHAAEESEALVLLQAESDLGSGHGRCVP